MLLSKTSKCTSCPINDKWFYERYKDWKLDTKLKVHTYVWQIGVFKLFLAPTPIYYSRYHHFSIQNVDFSSRIVP